MTDAIDHERRKSFERNAVAYDATRPAYPRAAIDDIVARSGAKRALEIGAGTGKATVMFAERGLDIVALEPAAQMAAVLRERVAGMHVEIVEQTFEATERTGFDLVYAAESFHWIEPTVRCAKAARVLWPGGALALITNVKAPIDPDLRRDFDAAYARRFGWPAWSPRHVAETEDKWVRELDASARFGAVHVGRFAWQATYTSAEYVALLDTYTDHAVRPERADLYADIKAAIDRRSGSIEIPYLTLVFFTLRLA